MALQMYAMLTCGELVGVLKGRNPCVKAAINVVLLSMIHAEL